MSQGQVFKLERAVTYLRSGKTTREVACGVTSLTPAEASPARLLHLIRRHGSCRSPDSDKFPLDFLE